LTGSLIVAGTCQGLAFTSVCVWHNVVRVSPEPLLLALGMGLGGLVLCHLRAACPTGRAWVLSFAAVVGVGVAVKLTFLPLAVIPWLMLPGWKYKVRYVAAASGCFVLATAPIWSQYRRFVQWMVGLLSHRGRYGSGEAGFDLAEYLGQLRALAWSEFPLLAVALAALAYVALRPILRRHAPEESAPVGRCLLALAVAMTGQFLMVAKHSSPRYLLPAFGLTGAVLALLLFDLLRTKDWAARLGRGVVLAGVGVLGWHGVQSFQAATHDKVATGQAFSGKLRDFFDAQPQRGVVVTYYGASSRAYALAFGNAWANNVCAASAAALHPPAYFYSVQGSGYSDLAGSALKPEAVMRLPGPVYFHGRPFSRADGRDRPADFQFESLLTNGRETLYRGLRPTTLPQ
ncbi:MAG: hypothetical protein JNM56_03250, partial [Planctomycetia bacterium]|nr:hypothetical protein [Planctomycetia bacterium]